LLQERIASLLSDPNSRKVLGANGRARFEQQFTLDQSVAKTLAVYRDVLAEVRPDSTSRASAAVTGNTT
jgi:glycosyltransferase involved in cell wall biosynthesis